MPLLHLPAYPGDIVDDPGARQTPARLLGGQHRAGDGPARGQINDWLVAQPEQLPLQLAGAIPLLAVQLLCLLSDTLLSNWTSSSATRKRGYNGGLRVVKEAGE